MLRGVSADDLARMMRQADVFGALRLSRTADLVIATLDEMTGATSPRLQLELMVARVLAQTAARRGLPQPAAAAMPAGCSAAAAAAPRRPVAPSAAPQRAVRAAATAARAVRAGR